MNINRECFNKAFAAMQDAFVNACIEMKCERPEYEALVQHPTALQANMLMLFRNLISLRDVSGQKKRLSPPLRKACVYISARFTDESISFVDITRVCGKSVTATSRLFRNELGMTFIAYVQRLRFEFARTLLADETYNISEVAFTSGFGSLGHFGRVFRKLSGVSPTEYREQLRKRGSC
jgi:AraC-like DNA-binding protein